jgi:hypothetical protein
MDCPLPGKSETLQAMRVWPRSCDKTNSCRSALGCPWPWNYAAGDKMHACLIHLLDSAGPDPHKTTPAVIIAR